MKNLLITFAFLFSATTVYSQFISNETAKKLKKKKLVVATAEYPEKCNDAKKAYIDAKNAAFKKAFETRWTFNQIHSFMPYKEAEKYVKANKDSCYFIAWGTQDTRTTVQSRGVRYITRGEYLSVYNPGRLYSNSMPYYEDSLDNAMAQYAVINLQYLIEKLYTDEVKSMLAYQSAINKSSMKLPEKTLLIQDNFLNPEVTPELIKEQYQHPFEICKYDRIKKAILEKDSSVVVGIYISMPGSGRYYDFIYFVSPVTGEIYAFINSNSMTLDLGLFGTVGDKKEYLINKKQLPQFKTMVKTPAVKK